MSPPDPAHLDSRYAELLRAGENVVAIREFLAGCPPDDLLMLGLLRRAVPMRFLEFVATTPPWSERPRTLAGVVMNPRTPPPLSLRVVQGLLWRDLAEVAHNPRLAAAVKNRAEALLLDQVADLRTGEKVTLAKIATPPVLRLVIADPDRKVSEAALINPRLREEDLLLAIRQANVPIGLLEEIAASSRWSANYAVRRELVLQPRTPLAVALAQITSLLARDLRRIGDTEELAPLVRRAALRVAQEGAP